MKAVAGFRIRLEQQQRISIQLPAGRNLLLTDTRSTTRCSVVVSGSAAFTSSWNTQPMVCRPSSIGTTVRSTIRRSSKNRAVHAQIALNERDRLAQAVIVAVDRDIRGVLNTDLDEWHLEPLACRDWAGTVDGRLREPEVDFARQTWSAPQHVRGLRSLRPHGWGSDRSTHGTPIGEWYGFSSRSTIGGR
jgi:hypothetical protein